MSHSPSARPLSAGQLTGQTDTHLISHQQHLLHRDMQPSFIQLQQAAIQAGFDLQIASAFRPFERQLLIWNNKFSGSRPLLDSNSLPIDASQLSELEKKSMPSCAGRRCPEPVGTTGEPISMSMPLIVCPMEPAFSWSHGICHWRPSGRVQCLAQ